MLKCQTSEYKHLPHSNNTIIAFVFTNYDDGQYNCRRPTVADEKIKNDRVRDVVWQRIDQHTLEVAAGWENSHLSRNVA